LKGKDTSCDSLGPKRVDAKLVQILVEERVSVLVGAHSWYTKDKAANSTGKLMSGYRLNSITGVFKNNNHSILFA